MGGKKKNMNLNLHKFTQSLNNWGNVQHNKHTNWLSTHSSFKQLSL